MATNTLGSMSTGSIIKLNENGEPVEFYVAKHDYESDLNGFGRTLVVRKDVYDTRQWHDSSVNAYATSSINSWLNGDYKNMLDADIQSVIGTTTYRYTPGNGNESVTTRSDAIFLLSMAELGKSNTYANVEGSALPIASILIEAYLDGSPSSQWTRSPYTRSTLRAWLVYFSGSISNVSCTHSSGVRPIFTLPSSLSVSDDGTVSVNTPPVITSSTPSGSNLGTKAEGFDLTYTVTDADGGTVTVKEYLDNVVKRSYTVTLGQSNTVQCVTAANWQKVLNGEHTIKIVANDGKADSAAYMVTFTKKVYSASITLATPMDVDDQITVMVLNLLGSIPEDADLEVLVTNNANDTSPIWEDATTDVINGNNHVFTNQTATNGFAFNFKVTVSRGDSNTGGYISNIGGAFQ